MTTKKIYSEEIRNLYGSSKYMMSEAEIQERYMQTPETQFEIKMAIADALALNDFIFERNCFCVQDDLLFGIDIDDNYIERVLH